ncbi:MAG: type II toxin-antitoxin system VapC family toxin [Treponemataceae bacterium]
MTYVIDASIAASLFLPDEEAETAKSVIRSVDADDAVLVPTLFWYEMANILWGSVRKGRLDEGPAFRALEMLRRLGLKTDDRSIEELVPSIFILSREHNLTSYDSAYLELAAREGAALCSHDSALRAAALRIGISVLPPAI